MRKGRLIGGPYTFLYEPDQSLYLLIAVAALTSIVIGVKEPKSVVT